MALLSAGVALLLMTGTGMSGPLTVNGTCQGRAGVTNISYVISEPDGSSHMVSELWNNVDRGDTIEALFVVPKECAPEELSFASYESLQPPTNLQAQTMYSSATGTFAAGQHSLTIHIIPASARTKHTRSGSAHTRVPQPQYFQLDFTTGAVHRLPQYGTNLIDTAKTRGY